MGTLPNPNLPVTEERLQEFYNRIKPFMGGGGGGGEEYTAGDGIDITNNEISTVKSESGDIDEIVEDLPPVTPIDLDEIVDPVPTPAPIPVHYSLDEQVIGTWYDGKPLYQKTVEFSGTWGAVGTITTVDIDTDTTHQWKMVNGYDNGSGAAFPSVSIDATNKSIQNNKIFGLNSGKLAIKFMCGDSYFVGRTFSGIAIIQYTKTTD